MQQESTFATASTKKQLSFFAALLIVIGSCIGAGIFFKSKSVLDNSGLSIVMSSFTWILAAVAVISMALALIEVASVKTASNLSVLGWNKVFNNKWIYNASKNFLAYVYLPLNNFYMPLYFLMSFQDGISEFMGGKGFKIDFSGNWIVILLIILTISTYFIFISGRVAKIGDLNNKIILAFKFLPLIIGSVLGFILIGAGSEVNNKITITEKTINDLRTGSSLGSLSVGFGLFIGLGAIFFAYDGFYVSAGVKSEMKEPNKSSLAILLGLSIVTIIYLFISVSMSLVKYTNEKGEVSSGDITTLGNAMRALKWNGTFVNIFSGTLNICIAIGILGIINGFAMWASRLYEDLVQSDEIPFVQKYKNKLNGNNPWVGTIINAVLSYVAIISFTLIGAFGYYNSESYEYGSYLNKLYSFADLLANWTSVIVFVFVALSILGALINRKTEKIQVDKFKYFKPFAYISVFIIGMSMLMTIAVPVVDLFLIAILNKDSTENYGSVVTGRIMKIVILIIFIVIMMIPTTKELSYRNIFKFKSKSKINNVNSL